MKENIWKHNIEALKQFGYSVLANALEGSIGSEDFICECEYIAGREVMFVQQGDKTWQLDTLYNQEKALDIWMNSIDMRGFQTKYIFCGFGNGMFARKILQKADSSACILVYEPSVTVFKKCIEIFDVQPIICDSRVKIIVKGYSETSVEDYLNKFITYEDIKNLIYHTYPNYDRFMKNEIKEYDELVQTTIMKVRATKNVLARYGRMNACNSLFNTALLMRSRSIVSLYESLPTNVPVILVASGPSLARNVCELHRAKRKMMIMAMDSAVPVLMKNDIMPDIIITLDSMKDLKHLEDSRAKHIPILCELESRYRLIVDQTGPIFFMNDLNPYINKFHRSHKIEFPVFTTGGSVANSACAILESMGFETIIFIGQDLAYTGDKAYAEGTVGSKREFSIDEQEEYYVDGYYGGRVRSSSEFILYLDWFEREIVKHPEIRYINATEGGAMIKGAINLSLKETIDTYGIECSDIQQRIENTSMLYTEEQQKELSAYMQDLPNKLQCNLNEIRKALRNYEKMCDILRNRQAGRNQLMKLLKRASAITERLENAYEMHYVFCMGQERLQNITENLNDRMDDSRQDMMQIAQRGVEYLQELESSCLEVIKYIQEKDLTSLWKV